MRSIVLSGLLCAFTAMVAPAQIIVQGGGVPTGIPAGASIWYGPVAPPASVGADGDYYVNTSNYCLYGPKAAGAWPSSCVSSITQFGYVAENVGTKGVAGGYAPLDVNALVPAANLPAISTVNGTTVPTNVASDQTVVTTAPGVGSWASLPACPDAGGFHLNYSAVTHGFQCGDTGGTVGSVNFGSVEDGTNTASLLVGGSLGYTGGGLVNANQLSGVPLSGLSTGLLKITSGTGTPGIATSTDVEATLGFTPENPANKGAATGYAPLDASAKVLVTNLPLIPYSQTTGVQAALGFSPENAANKNAANGYAPLDANKLLPIANLPVISTLSGTSVPSNTASDQTVVTTAPSVGAWTALPSCPDTGGNHLNYSQATHGFLCGSTGGTAGSVGFSGVGTGTNANALLIGGSLGYTGAGQVNANQLSGVSLPSLSTGLLKITTGTGTPSIAGLSDITSTLGFTPENGANKNAANGYAPLDANKLLPADNLPAITAVSGTSVPSSSASDQTVVTTAAAVGAWTALPSCPDTGGNHLNYSQVTHGFLCGSTAGSVGFNGVGTGTNANALLIAGSLGYTGGGQVNANQISGVLLPSLSTGLLKITTGTGAPSIAAASDVTATLGFTPENGANKNAANGYAPLDANKLLPVANLPAITSVNGTSVPSNGASDQTVVTTAPAVGAWTALPSCPDTGGNHLNYSQVMHGFLCGNTGGSAGSVAFNGVGTGTNANALLISGSLGYTGAGQVNANQLSGVSLPGLNTGLLKITTGTGAPSIAAASDVTATLGFAPENTATKNAANGYAPLDANKLLPTANLPAITAVNGTSVPSNGASDQTVVTTAPAVGAWTALPSCPDTGGNHLYYSQVTHGFLCGNTGGSAGSVGFNGVGTGTNANALLISGSLGYTGAGQVNANQLSGVSLSGLPTGLLKVTTGTGAPSIAAPSDVTSSLGFTPESVTNKNAANGYAPLDANALLPAANLPTSALTSATIGNGTLSASFTGLTTASDVDAGGNVNAAGSVYANTSSTVAGCLHLADTNGVHDMGICAPTSGFNGLLNLPSAAGAAGKALFSDGMGGSLWSNALPTLTIGTGSTAALLSAYADPTAAGYNAFFGANAGNQTMGPAGGSSGLASFNVGIGYSALAANTTGFQNIAIGEDALTANTAGGQNVAIGSLAMAANTTGSYNTAVGENALGNNTTGYDNFAFGLRALYQNTTGYNNAAFGIDSVGINQTGYRNSGFGVDSCAWIVTGYENSCMGMNTVWSGTTGYDNTGAGFNAMFGVTSGHYNTGLGAYADYFYPNTMSGVTLALAAGTKLNVGWYWYKVSFVLNGQETALSNNSYLGILTTTGNQEVSISGIPTYSGPFTATARRIYRTVGCPTTLCTVVTANQLPRHWCYVATIGDNTTTTYLDTTPDASLGAEESSTPSQSIALGAYATVYNSNQMAVGSDPSPIYQIWLGNGVTTAMAPAGVQLASSGGSGTNVAGEDLILAGGPGTGSASGGNAIFKYAPAGASGSAWNSLVESFRFTGTGVFRAASGGTLDISSAAHSTPAKVGAGASKPTTCAVGEQYFASDATAGQNIFGCTAANTWTLQGGSGSGAVASVFGRTGVVAAAAGDYTAAQVTNAVSTLGSYSSPAWLTAVTFGGTTLSSTGGTVYNNAGTGNTQLVFKNSSSQATNGAGSLLFQNNAGSTMSFINWDGGFAEGDGINYKISLDTVTAGLSSDSIIAWHSQNNVFAGSIDTGLARASAGVLNVTNGSTGYGTLNAGALQIQGTPLAKVATSGSYGDLSNQPAIPAAQVNSDWNAASGPAQILNKPALAAVATSGSASDLGTGTLPAAQLPAPGASTLGGVQSKDCSGGGQFVQKINTDGSETCATPAGGGTVTSVFGRTGVVVAASGDYTAAQVTNAVSTAGSYSNPAWLTSVQFGGTTLNSTGGTIYNNAATGYTQLTMQDSSSQAGAGQAQILMQNHAGANMMFIGPSSGFAVGDGTNWKSLFSASTQLASSDFNFQFKNVNNVFSGTSDVGYARGSAGVFKITNGSNGYGTLDASGYSASGTAGLTIVKTVKGSDGNNCTMTFTAGLLTATTCP